MGIYEVIPIGEKLKKIREKYKMKQEDLAGGEVTRNLISQIEHSKARLTKSTAEIIFKNLNRICSERHIKVDESIEYLMEDEKYQANKILDRYIKELKDLSLYKDTSFVNKLSEAEKFLLQWDIKDKKIAVFEAAGDYFCSINDFYKSSIYYEKAKALINLHNKSSVSMLRKLSMVYFYMGEYEQGIRCCEFALNWFDDMEEEYSCIFLFNSATYYLKLQDYHKAIEKLNILEPKIKNVDINKYYEVLGQKAVCLQALKKYHESLNIYDKLLEYMSKEDYERRTLIFVNISEIYVDMKKENEAKKYLNLTLSNIIKLNKESQHLAGLNYELGKTYRRLNNFDNAEKYFLNSLTLAKKQAYYFLVEDIIFQLIDVYECTNNIKKIIEIKNEVFILISKEGKVYNKLIYRLIKLYIKIGNVESANELIDFCQKFI